MDFPKIYELMMLEGEVTAVRIADKLDFDLNEVSATMRELVALGTVERRSGTAKNGHPTQFYNLSSDFKFSNDYKAIVAGMTPKAIEQLADQVAVVETPAPPAAPEPVAPAIKETDSRLDKVARVVEYVKGHGPGATISNAELRVYMGLTGNQMPNTFLTPALRDGRLMRNGHRWQLGVGKPTVMPPPVELMNNTDFLEVRGTPTTSAELERIIEKAAPAPSAFRCAMWCDGTIELQRDGKSLAVLSPVEFKHLIFFVDDAVQPKWYFPEED